MASCCSDNDRSFDALLASDLAEVDGCSGAREQSVDVDRRVGLDVEPSGEDADHLGEGAGAEGVDPLDDGGFACVLAGEDDAIEIAGPRERRHRDRAADGTEPAVEREFTREQIASRVRERFLHRPLGGRHDPVCLEQRDRERQVVERAFLSDIGRREIRQDVSRSHVPRVRERGLHPLERLPDRRIGQAHDNVALRFGARGLTVIHLDFAGGGIDPGEQIRLHSCKHPPTLPRDRRLAGMSERDAHNRLRTVAAQFRPAITPPSTSHTAPVTQLDSSLSRKSITDATSVGWPIRPSGWNPLNPASVSATWSFSMNAS